MGEPHEIPEREMKVSSVGYAFPIPVNGFIRGIDFPTCRRNSARFNEFSEKRGSMEIDLPVTGEEEREEGRKEGFQHSPRAHRGA